jgi:hypothetical protein
MKVQIAALGIAVALYCSPAFAQHGNSGSAMGHMGGNAVGNGHVMSTSAHANGNSTGPHGMTMTQQLTKNTKLAGKIKTLTGLDAQSACDGFKNLGQCVAAAHVSKNLKISFDCLKSDMTGTAPASGSTCPAGTGTSKMSLGKSIQTLSPNSDSKSETKKGQQEADQDLKSNS